MKLGAEPKKLAILGGLVVVALAVFIFNSSSGSDSGAPASTPASRPASQTASGLPATSPGAPRETPGSGTSTPARNRRQVQEFRPSLKPKRGEERPDPMSIDPTLRLDMLAKLQTVNVEGTHRSIFDFGQAPPPKPDPAKAGPAKPVPSPIVPVAPVKPTEAAKIEPAKPVAPPIPLKFYGYVNPTGAPQKRAFFMEGEEIHVVQEGDLIKKRYKVVRIGVNSAQVQDTQFPGSPTQTLPLEEQPG